ncbi:MAG: hypothetical protein NTV29_04630 [Planctomycetota bacterium]|nr:hypothetical protein [Planctomycetota bacterium]
MLGHPLAQSALARRIPAIVGNDLVRGDDNQTSGWIRKGGLVRGNPTRFTI